MKRKRTDASDLPSLWKSWFREAKAIPLPRATQHFTSCLARWNFKISLWFGGTLCARVIRRAWNSRRLFCFLFPPFSPHLYLGCQEEKAKTPNSLGSAARCQVRIFIRPFCLWGGFLHTWCQSFSRVRIVCCLHAARAPGKRPRSSRRPQRPRHLAHGARVSSHWS